MSLAIYGNGPDLWLLKFWPKILPIGPVGRNNGHKTGPVPYTGSFSKAGFSQEAVKQLFFALFCCFLDYFHSKIWAPFDFGTFEP